MGANVSKRTSSKRAAKALILNNNVRSSSQRSSIIEAINPGCLKKRKTKKIQKGPLQPPEKRFTKVSSILTLEDWLLASPGPTGLQLDSLSGGELYVFKHFPTRAHPSSVIKAHEAVISAPADSFLVDISSGDASFSSLSRSQSGKIKKKVSFRLPEEADIKIFYSPVEAFATSKASF